MTGVASGPSGLHGFLLGISSGGLCLATCAPVLLPCLLGEGKTVAGNALSVASFLLGRLAGYLLFGVAAWGGGLALVRWEGPRTLATGAVYGVLALLLVAYGLGWRKSACSTKDVPQSPRRPDSTLLFLSVLGAATGLNLCPPFLLALTSASQQGTLGSSLAFFFAFFLGTSLFFVPAPLIGALHRHATLRIVGRMAAGLMGLYYLYMGAILMIGGMETL